MKRENKYKKALETLRKAQKYEQNKEKIEAFEKYHQLADWYKKNDYAPNHVDVVKRIMKIYEQYESKGGDSQ